jgi:transposase InsO family protein
VTIFYPIIRALEQVIERHGQPASIRGDNVPEYISTALQAWAEKRGIRLHSTSPESFNKIIYSNVTMVMTIWKLNNLSRRLLFFPILTLSLK